MNPLILITNDDGIASRGLWAVAEAVLPLGRILVVAPERQWSGCGRSMPTDVTFAVKDASRVLCGHKIPAYAVDASPAQAVALAVLDLAKQQPDLVISGANHGANLGIEVTISGTVGAAIEAAAFGIPALAVSLEMDNYYFLDGDPQADYSVTQYVVAKLVQHILQRGLPQGVDFLNVNIPYRAVPATPWRITHLSRLRYFVPLPPDRARGRDRPSYTLLKNPSATEPDSDIHALLVERVVSVTPLSLDMTAPLDTTSHHFTLDCNVHLGQVQTTGMPLTPLPMLEAKLSP